MKITNKLSIAALVLTGAFATGCSQQQVAGDSGASQSAGSQQVAGGSQASGGSQQSAGGSQVQNGGGSQQAGSQQQVETPVVAQPPVAQPPVAQPPVAPPPRVAPPKRYQNPWAHYHAEAPACAKTKRHSHKYKKTGAPHRHSYGCQPRRVNRVAPQPRQPQVDVFALQRKLKAKGYYKGPIDGVVGSGTRAALKRFMQR